MADGLPALHEQTTDAKLNAAPQSCRCVRVVTAPKSGLPPDESCAWALCLGAAYLDMP